MALALGAMEALDSTVPMESKPQAEIAMSALDERIYKRARKRQVETLSKRAV